jgi:hypothetical protein
MAARTVCLMRKTFALLALLLAAFFSLAPSAAEATRCRDGSYSRSSGPGTCSWHGGIDDGTPSQLGGGGDGSGSGTSGIYYGPSNRDDDSINLEDEPGFWLLLGGAAAFWIWALKAFG